MTWKINTVDFADYGVVVTKSSGVLDLPDIVDQSTDWIDLNGKEYWQSQSDVKYQDTEIVLQCWIFATGYSDFKTKVQAFFDALNNVGSISLLTTPFGSDIAISLIQSVQVVRKSQYVQSIQAGQFTLRLTVVGDSQTKLITIYNSDDTILAYGSYGNDARLTRSLQGSNEISLTLEFSTMQSLGRGNYVMYGGEKYISLEYPEIDKISTNKYVYRITYANQYFLLKDIQFRSVNESDFYWWANVDNVVDKLIENAERGYPGLFMKGTIDATEYRNHQFQNENCYDVLSRITADYELEFEYTWNSLSSQIQINVRAQIGNATGLSVEYGKDNGAYKINRVSTGRELLVTRLYAYGSEKNIPAGYGYPRLKLATEPVTGSFFGMHIEKTKIWDDIFPHRTGSVTSYTFTPDTTYPENTTYTVEDNTMFDLTAVSGGSSIYLNGATPAKLHFNSGELAGFEFEVNKFVFDTLAATGGTFYLTPIKEMPDIIYPNVDFQPTAGDEYVLLDINLPQSYIDTAEAELQAAANEHIADFVNPKPTYTIETDPSFTFGALLPGDTITLIDADFGLPTGLLTRITEITTNLYRGGSTMSLSSYVAKSKRQIQTETIAKIEKSIVNAKLDEVNVLRGTEQTVLDLANEVFNPLDKKQNVDKTIRSESLDPRMLAYDAGIPQFYIKDALIETNVDNDEDKVRIGDGSISITNWRNATKIRDEILAGYDPTRTWTITETNFVLATKATHFMYAKIDLTSESTDCEIVVHEEHQEVKSVNGYLMYKLGYISAGEE